MRQLINNRGASLVALFLVTVLMILWSGLVGAVPLFARKYELSCSACHAAYPRLNQFGITFRDNNMRLPNWKEANTVNTGDNKLVLPKQAPLAFRAQAYAQARDANFIDPVTGATVNANTDF